jgi:hypothetical protein
VGVGDEADATGVELAGRGGQHGADPPAFRACRWRHRRVLRDGPRAQPACRPSTCRSQGRALQSGAASASALKRSGRRCPGPREGSGQVTR